MPFPVLATRTTPGTSENTPSTTPVERGHQNTLLIVHSRLYGLNLVPNLSVETFKPKSGMSPWDAVGAGE